MKVAILAGGLGTRLSEETVLKPKPMVQIGGRPILWHIMKMYAAHGYKEFVLALGYKSEVIKDYFINYRHHAHSLTVDLSSGHVTVHNGDCEDWRIHLLDTGLNTETGGRIKQIAQYIGPEPFMLTYGDGVSNVDIRQLVNFHRDHGKTATVTAVRPAARFGDLSLDGNRVAKFTEKPQTGAGWINGGFFVLEPEVFEYLKGGDDLIFEKDPLEQLSQDGELMVYRHNDFWRCMDTMRDVQLLDGLWQGGKAPWKIWETPVPV
ncbi:MAG: glucose-1-phosphate cytidylyltransferase [Ferruginibacter sp.]|nr:glucose-1-phosphate cytidylyltransferase [Cytophagales bacterium]